MNATFIYVFLQKKKKFYIPNTIQIKQWEKLKYMFIILECFILFTGILHYFWM